MVETQVGVRVYVAAVAVNARGREVVHTSPWVSCGSRQRARGVEGWKGGAQNAVSACVRAAVVVNASERGGGPLRIRWK